MEKYIPSTSGRSRQASPMKPFSNSSTKQLRETLAHLREENQNYQKEKRILNQSIASISKDSEKLELAIADRLKEIEKLKRNSRQFENELKIIQNNNIREKNDCDDSEKSYNEKKDDKRSVTYLSKKLNMFRGMAVNYRSAKDKLEKLKEIQKYETLFHRLIKINQDLTKQAHSLLNGNASGNFSVSYCRSPVQFRSKNSNKVENTEDILFSTDSFSGKPNIQSPMAISLRKKANSNIYNGLLTGLGQKLKQNYRVIQTIPQNYSFSTSAGINSHSSLRPSHFNQDNYNGASPRSQLTLGSFLFKCNDSINDDFNFGINDERYTKTNIDKLIREKEREIKLNYDFRDLTVLIDRFDRFKEGNQKRAIARAKKRKMQQKSSGNINEINIKESEIDNDSVHAGLNDYYSEENEVKTQPAAAMMTTSSAAETPKSTIKTTTIAASTTPKATYNNNNYISPINKTQTNENNKNETPGPRRTIKFATNHTVVPAPSSTQKSSDKNEAVPLKKPLMKRNSPKIERDSPTRLINECRAILQNLSSKPPTDSNEPPNMDDENQENLTSNTSPAFQLMAQNINKLTSTTSGTNSAAADEDDSSKFTLMPLSESSSSSSKSPTEGQSKTGEDKKLFPSVEDISSETGKFIHLCDDDDYSSNDGNNKGSFQDNGGTAINVNANVESNADGNENNNNDDKVNVSNNENSNIADSDENNVNKGKSGGVVSIINDDEEDGNDDIIDISKINGNGDNNNENVKDDNNDNKVNINNAKSDVDSDDEIVNLNDVKDDNNKAEDNIENNKNTENSNNIADDDKSNEIVSINNEETDENKKDEIVDANNDETVENESNEIVNANKDQTEENKSNEITNVNNDETEENKGNEIVNLNNDETKENKSGEVVNVNNEEPDENKDNEIPSISNNDANDNNNNNVVEEPANKNIINSPQQISGASLRARMSSRSSPSNNTQDANIEEEEYSQYDSEPLMFTPRPPSETKIKAFVASPVTPKESENDSNNNIEEEEEDKSENKKDADYPGYNQLKSGGKLAFSQHFYKNNMSTRILRAQLFAKVNDLECQIQKLRSEISMLKDDHKLNDFEREIEAENKLRQQITEEYEKEQERKKQRKKELMNLRHTISYNVENYYVDAKLDVVDFNQFKNDQISKQRRENAATNHVNEHKSINSPKGNNIDVFYDNQNEINNDIIDNDYYIDYVNYVRNDAASNFDLKSTESLITKQDIEKIEKIQRLRLQLYNIKQENDQLQKKYDLEKKKSKSAAYMEAATNLQNSIKNGRKIMRDGTFESLKYQEELEKLQLKLNDEISANEIIREKTERLTQKPKQSVTAMVRAMKELELAESAIKRKMNSLQIEEEMIDSKINEITQMCEGDEIIQQKQEINSLKNAFKRRIPEDISHIVEPGEIEHLKKKLNEVNKKKIQYKQNKDDFDLKINKDLSELYKLSSDISYRYFMPGASNASPNSYSSLSLNSNSMNAANNSKSLIFKPPSASQFDQQNYSLNFI